MTTVLPSVTIGVTITRVFAEHTRRRGRHVQLLHEIAECKTRTTCYVGPIGKPRDARDRVTDPATLVDWNQVQWCGYCWLGHRRCVICSAPSGDHCECAGCIKRSIDVDTRFRRAVA